MYICIYVDKQEYGKAFLTQVPEALYIQGIRPDQNNQYNLMVTYITSSMKPCDLVTVEWHTLP